MSYPQEGLLVGGQIEASITLGETMRINLSAKFEDRDFVRRHGAKWDAARKVWFLENPEEKQIRALSHFMPQYFGGSRENRLQNR